MLQPATTTHCSSYWPPWMWTRTVKWDDAPPAWAKQIEHGRVLVIFCPPYLIDIPLEPARCRCASAMIRALLGCGNDEREEHARTSLWSLSSKAGDDILRHNDMRCPACGNEFSGGARLCPSCCSSADIGSGPTLEPESSPRSVVPPGDSPGATPRKRSSSPSANISTSSGYEA